MCYERRGRTRSFVRMSYKSIKSLIFRRIRQQKLCVNAPHKLVLRQPSVCLLLMRSMFLNLQTSLLFQSKVVSSISVRAKSYFGGCSRRLLLEVTSPEVTWLEAALTWNDVTEVIACACATDSRTFFLL